jgi:hypothetical protein
MGALPSALIMACPSDNFVLVTGSVTQRDSLATAPIAHIART